ncbi:MULTISPECIES: AbrB/MazE/SpoVT family DNA-binding domain-containing protein [unclassified Synechococcus]|uniref:AbrB/MazE/SpoVT family DNA-binding domain-containing protein n=1 Tax=unclassified Synechococcus TaxID=2626047 RepID=UPI00055EE6A4|nr:MULTISPECIES: AbrB/MazE/SpoVT family DNA-binding domain-containing protein [unclassified Synechococcus]WFN58368.1 AbrB/MazE/SpoVT family DNA-binding domain-containing protein [Synechococcus sp. CCFWC 502]
MDVATLTVKGQVTVPKAVREALGLRQGDLLSWELAYLQGLERGLSEWSSPADENAFRDL